MGYTWLWGGMPGAQTTELWGFRFLNTLFYVFNLLFLIVWHHRWDKTGRTALAGALALFVFLNGLGFYLKNRLPAPDKLLNVIVIQNNIGSIAHLDRKTFPSAEKRALHISKSLTYRAFLKYAKEKEKRKKIHFILWPEGAYGYSISKRAQREKRLSKIVQTIQIPLITGAVSRDRGKYGGALFVFNREGGNFKAGL